MMLWLFLDMLSFDHAISSIIVILMLPHFYPKQGDHLPLIVQTQPCFDNTGPFASGF